MLLQELTTRLLKMRFEQPQLWAEFGPYWASCPAPGGLASKYMFEEEHIPLLQDAELVRQASMPLAACRTSPPCTLCP